MISLSNVQTTSFPRININTRIKGLSDIICRTEIENELGRITEYIIHTQDDQVKKALADLGWICPQEAKAMRADLAAKDAEISKLKDEVHSERAHWQDWIVRERNDIMARAGNGILTAIAPLAKLPHIGDPPSAGVVLVGRVWHDENEVRKAAESLGLREAPAVMVPVEGTA